MTLRERLLRPFKGWAPFECDTVNKSPTKSFLDHHKTGLTLLIVLVTSIVGISYGALSMMPAPLPPIPHITPTTPAYLATCEFNGRLRFIRFDDASQTFQITQSIDNVFYESLAFGDIDNDGEQEFLGASTTKLSDDLSTVLTVTLDVYEKNGDRWELSYSIDALEPIREAQSYRDFEILVTNVDDIIGNEIIVKSHDWLAIFQFEYSSGEFILLSAIQPVIEGVSIALESMDVGDIDNDGVTELVVSANNLNNDDQGHLMIFHDVSLADSIVIPVDIHLGPTASYYTEVGAKFRHHSLHVGDLDGDDDLEICSSGFSYTSTESQPNPSLYSAGMGYRDHLKHYLYIWDHEGMLVSKIFLYEVLTGHWESLTIPERNAPHITADIVFDVGELDPDLQGDEIAYWFAGGREIQGEDKWVWWKLTVSHFDGVHLSELWSFETGGGRNVYIADADGDLDNEVIIGGSRARYYLEIFDDLGRSMWVRDVDEVGEGDVMYIAIG